MITSIVVVKPIKQQQENTADMADTVENMAEEVAAVIARGGCSGEFRNS